MKYSIKLLAFMLCVFSLQTHCRMSRLQIQSKLNQILQQKYLSDQDLHEFKELINQYASGAGQTAARKYQKKYDEIILKQKSQPITETQSTPVEPIIQTPVSVVPTHQPSVIPQAPPLFESTTPQMSEPATQAPSQLYTLDELITLKPNFAYLSTSQKNNALTRVASLQKQIDDLVFGSERNAQQLIMKVNNVVSNFKKDLTSILQKDTEILNNQYQRYSLRAQELLAQHDEKQAQQIVLTLLMALDNQLFELKYALELAPSQSTPTKPAPQETSTSTQPTKQPKPAQQLPVLTKTPEKQPTIIPIYNRPTSEELSQKNLKQAESKQRAKDPLSFIKDATQTLDNAQDNLDQDWNELPLPTARARATQLQTTIAAAITDLETIKIDNKQVFDGSDGKEYANRLQKLIVASDSSATALKSAAKKLVNWFDNALEELTKGKYYKTLLLLQTK